MATPRYTNIGRTNIVRTDEGATERQRLGEQAFASQLQERENQRLLDEQRSAELAELQRQEDESVIQGIGRAGRPALPGLQRTPDDIEVFNPRPFTTGESAALEGLRAVQGAGNVARVGGGLAGLGSLGALAAAPFTGGASLPLAASLAGLSTAGMGVGAAATAINPRSEEGQTRLSAIPEAALAALPAITKRVAPIIGAGFKRLDRFFRDAPDVERLAERVEAYNRAYRPTNRQILVENAGKIARAREAAEAGRSEVNRVILSQNQDKLNRLRELLSPAVRPAGTARPNVSNVKLDWLPESWRPFVKYE